jgi:hypothetical protein
MNRANVRSAAIPTNDPTSNEEEEQQQQVKKKKKLNETHPNQISSLPSPLLTNVIDFL